VNRLLAIGVLFIFISSSVISISGIDTKQRVQSSSGKTLYVGGSGPGNYTKIQDAINDSEDGDTVFVYNDSSPYIENLVVDKSINLIGEDKYTTIINTTGYHCDHVIKANWVNVSCFTLLGSKNSIIDISANNIVISNNTIDKIVLVHNSFSNNNTISHNRITRTYVYVGWDDIIISDNIISDCDSLVGCIYVGVTGCSNIVITRNEIYHSSFGIWIFRRLSDCIISNNKISNTTIGLKMDESDNLSISRNIFVNNEVALEIMDSNNVNVSENAFIENEHGIVISGPSHPNYIYHNNFINNWRNAQFSFGSINNKWEGNYWNRPRILPKPIFGSIIFSRPNWLNFDWRPAQEPYDIEV
jgi:parallel beta-helix repeat protein